MNVAITPQYWMNIAKQIAEASTCRAKVGCILVHKNVIVGHGYVGSVHGDYHCEDEVSGVIDGKPWVRKLDQHVLIDAPHRGKKKTTCIRTIHAEMNAILKCAVRGNESDGWIRCFSTHQPCLDCLKCLLQIGVRAIRYNEPYEDARRDLFVNKCILFDRVVFGLQNVAHMSKVEYE